MGELNIELFKKVRERIATIPESYDQGAWCRKGALSPCGTAACLAGEAIICNAPTVEEGIAELHRLDEEPDPLTIARRAAQLLGLRATVASYLDKEANIFLENGYGWPNPFRAMFVTDGPASAAVAYLDHIIETGKVLE